jgi:RNA polymerase sigma-70 factor (ECF subfamily)
VTRSRSEAPDESLLERFAGGDDEAFEVLVERYQRPMFNFVRRSVQDPAVAEDILQETFLRVVQRAEEFRGQAKVSTWMYTIARNLCVDHARKMVHRRHASLDAPGRRGDDDDRALVDRIAGPAMGSDRIAIGEQLKVAVASAVEQLPADQREVFLLRQLEHLSFQEIADICGIPENTAKSRMRYALERLKAALHEYEDYVRELS